MFRPFEATSNALAQKIVIIVTKAVLILNFVLVAPCTPKESKKSMQR